MGLNFLPLILPVSTILFCLGSLHKPTYTEYVLCADRHLARIQKDLDKQREQTMLTDSFLVMF